MTSDSLGITPQAAIWDDRVLPGKTPGAPTCREVAVPDPRYCESLLLASPLAVSAQVLAALSRDR